MVGVSEGKHTEILTEKVKFDLGVTLGKYFKREETKLDSATRRAGARVERDTISL
jgi:hypothetical protein